LGLNAPGRISLTRLSIMMKPTRCTHFTAKEKDLTSFSIMIKHLRKTQITSRIIDSKMSTIMTSARCSCLTTRLLSLEVQAKSYSSDTNKIPSPARSDGNNIIVYPREVSSTPSKETKDCK